MSVEPIGNIIAVSKYAVAFGEILMKEKCLLCAVIRLQDKIDLFITCQTKVRSSKSFTQNKFSFNERRNNDNEG